MHMRAHTRAYGLLGLALFDERGLTQLASVLDLVFTRTVVVCTRTQIMRMCDTQRTCACVVIVASCIAMQLQ